jgi:hypothetical protein
MMRDGTEARSGETACGLDPKDDGPVTRQRHAPEHYREASAIAERLSDEAKRDIREGNCVKGEAICVCGSSVAVKGELAHYRLAEFPANHAAGCLLNRNGLTVRTLLKDHQDG